MTATSGILADLYDVYAPALNGVIGVFTADQEMVHGILQQSFIVMHRKISSAPIDSDETFGWMLRITLFQVRHTLKISTSDIVKKIAIQAG